MSAEIGMDKPLVGISACLLGKKVRHNGEHKRNDWIVDHLGKWVEWIPFCPEVEMGLGVPRSTIHLERHEGLGQSQLILQNSHTHENLTLRAHKAAESIFNRDFQGGMIQLDGIILKKSSPSCGLERVKVYGKNNIPTRDGVGVFASYMKERFTFVPMIEEGRLSDPFQREVFTTKVFASHHLHRVKEQMANIQDFHRRAKLLIMAHSEVHYTKLGRLVGNQEKLLLSELLCRYQRLFYEALCIPSTTKKRVNVLQHILGYFKNLLDSKERHLILKTIEQYHFGYLPFVAPVTILKHLIQKFEITYLEDQIFLSPHPPELGLLKGI